ncbi:hypothetical protein WMY93_030250 [Mugilogobius chulae]|uniref:Uncharacterized protein n=1 Tax=Mugilogobius chulae TaxID=88201 RepID=A0AAW0MYZ3_9GOBI
MDLDIVVVMVVKEQNKSVKVDVAIPRNGDMRREREKLEKYQELIEKLEKVWKCQYLFARAPCEAWIQHTEHILQPHKGLPVLLTNEQRRGQRASLRASCRQRDRSH